MAKKKGEELQCCPELVEGNVCDTINLRYQLPFYTRVNDNLQNVRVHVIYHFVLERCSGPIMTGDPVYSTTLLPGEKVRLFTSDRHTRWSYDSESNLSYRHETTSEESFLTYSMAQAMSDLTISESGEGSSSSEESWAEGGGGAGLNLGIIKIGGGGSGGSYDASSAYEFSRSLSSHAKSTSMSAAAGVRAKSATSIGEVEQRQHAEGESEAHYESASRTFSNPNRCSAVTFLFHQLVKRQTIRFKLVAIERRVDDPEAPTGASQRIPIDTAGRVTVLPQAIAATNPKRLEIEEIARTSAIERRQAEQSVYWNSTGVKSTRYYPLETAAGAFDSNVRKAALEAVDKDLIAEGILDRKTGEPTEKVIAELSWEREEFIPTAGVIVRGCLDECHICEPALQKEIRLDLERKQLENALLEKQIALLEQSQEYRCCPGGSTESEAPSDA
jgi:hypothetical protein